MPTVRASAPVRFCDLGGWTDTWFYPKGCVLNFCASARTFVTIKLQPAERPGYSFESLDLGEKFSVKVEELRRGEYQHTLELVQAALSNVDLTLTTNAPGYTGFRHKEVVVLVSSQAPPGSGLGSSAALTVAAKGACEMLARGYIPHWKEIATGARDLEVKQGAEVGIQDHMASAHGGISFMEVDFPDARVTQVPVSLRTLCELNRRFKVAYVGRSRISGDMHHKVIAEFQAGHNTHLFEALVRSAQVGKQALLEGDLDAFGAAMNSNWEAQSGLHPDIVTPEIREIEAIAAKHGAIGFKANGAGGGGSVTMLASEDGDFHLEQELKQRGYTLIDSKIDMDGVLVWPPAGGKPSAA